MGRETGPEASPPSAGAKPDRAPPLPTASTPESTVRLPTPAPRGVLGDLKAWAKRHKRVLWWLHSTYALSLGVMVILFASKGFGHARVLAATLGGAFLMVVVIFRLFGQGAAQRERIDERKSLKISFLGMTYVVKNLYQGMLFFALPFYWKSSSLDSINAWFVFLLGFFALLSTLDLVFDNLLMRYRIVAAIFYAVTLFACANLVIPAFFSNVPTIVLLLSSTVLSVFGFWLLHFPLRTLRDKRTWVMLGSVASAAVIAVYLARFAIPPVPLYVEHHGVGIAPLPDGRLELEVTRVHKSRLDDLYAVSDVVMPGGEGDRFRHVWRHKKADVSFRAERDARVVQKASDQTVRVMSSMPKAELERADPVGEWIVDIVTTDDQIVGRLRFSVIE